MTLCQFAMTFTDTDDGLLFYPYCGCGWIGEGTLYPNLPSDAQLEGIARRWERHRVEFAKRQIRVGP